MWSSEGRVLLFALEGECVIYTLRFTQAPYSLDADCHVLTDMGLGEAYVMSPTSRFPFRAWRALHGRFSDAS